ncbi:MAG TPA: coenzyme F420-0:L-glutamate ligase [Candidatus Dormibacteraeota bacterium]|jgi:coenzyme F420-0:L-glutamate ligase/coenzyme F420-1:gamma-L-glutamate ligase|nr:coenzyme F420-0:L-glutamate ligase [Candidatus Dormibacteraeota bacterium]
MTPDAPDQVPVPANGAGPATPVAVPATRDAAGRAARAVDAVTIVPVRGLPEVAAGADVPGLILAALAAQSLALQDGDVLVVASKILSKAEGAVVTTPPKPGPEALRQAVITGFPAAEVQVILDQSTRVVRSAPGVLVAETRHGFVCANAGVDRSNTAVAGTALTLPGDSDAWAARLRAALEAAFEPGLAVLVSDTFGRPFRNGQVNVAVGVSGMRAVRDYRGRTDPAGYRLKGTELAVADELCSAAELVMNKLDRVPVAVIRGYAFDPGAGTVAPLLRDPALDIFR